MVGDYEDDEEVCPFCESLIEDCDCEDDEEDDEED